MNEVREKPIEGLDAAEVRIFDLMQVTYEESLWDDQTISELRNWFTRAIRSYVASGCDPNSFRRALGSLPEVAQTVLNGWIHTQERVLKDKSLRSMIINDMKSFKQEISAADRIVARLGDKEARFRLMMYAGATDEVVGGGADAQR